MPTTLIKSAFDPSDARARMPLDHAKAETLARSSLALLRALTDPLPDQEGPDGIVLAMGNCRWCDPATGKRCWSTLAVQIAGPPL